MNIRAYWKYGSMEEGFKEYKGRHHGKAMRAFNRFIDTRMYRKYPTIEKAWKDYRK